MGSGNSKTLEVAQSYPEEEIDLDSYYKQNPWKPKIFANELASIPYSKGTGSIPSLTVPQCFKAAAERWADKPALAYEPAHTTKQKPDSEEDAESQPRETWHTWTWGEMYQTCKSLAKSNMAVGLLENQGIAIWGFNSPFWMMASLSGMIGGGISMGIYPTDTPEIVAYKIKHCNTAVAFVESAYHQKIIEDLYMEKKLEVGVSRRFTQLKAIVVWGTPEPSRCPNLPVYSFDDYLKLSSKTPDWKLEKAMAQAPGKVVSYCYTSGTTGMPKAVMMTNDNLTYAIRAHINTGFVETMPIPEQIRIVSYLPLSHIAATAMDMMAPVVGSAGMHINPAHNESYSTIYFVRPYDLREGTLTKRLMCVRPSMFLAVPRVWEKIEFVMKSMAQTGVVGNIIQSLKDKMLQNSKNIQLGGTGSQVWGSTIANALGNSIKAKLGLDEAIICITGASPIRRSTVEYFASIGIDIYECWGMSETTGVGVVNVPFSAQWGSIGGQMRGAEMGIFDMKDNPVNGKFEYGQPIPENVQGEIRTRGRHVTMGYMANPDLGEEHVQEILKKNKSTILPSGWLCTGDKGAQNSQNMYKITGRFKELIITAGGENVAPVPIEDSVKILCNGVSNVLMYGDNRPYNTALITVRTEGYTGEQPGSNILDPSVLELMPNPDVRTVQDLLTKDASHPIIAAIIKAVQDTNANDLVCPSNACKIQRFTILPVDFSVVGGELTPTLKLKRSVVEKQYAEAIEALYGASREAKYVRFPSAAKAKL